AIAQQSRWRIINFAYTDCAFEFGSDGSDTSPADCRAFNQDVIEEVRGLHPDAVFTKATVFEDDGTESLPDGYIRAWGALAQAGVTVIAVRDNPSFGFDVSACIELRGASAPECTVPRPRALHEPSPFRLLKRPPANVRFVDLGDYFCTPASCLPV